MAAAALAPAGTPIGSGTCLGAAGAGRRSVAVGQARAELHRRAARRAAHRAADSRAARSRSDRQRDQPAADAAAPCAAARDRLRRRAAAGRETGATCARSAARRRARRSGRRRAADACTGGGSSNSDARDHRRPYRSASSSRTQTSFTTPALTALGEFRASLAHLQDLDSEALSHLMQGTLDLSAHRLDAWVTSFATKRLAAMHIDGPAGQYIGAYGWVENLRPIPASLVKPVPDAAGRRAGPAADRRRTTAASFTRRRWRTPRPRRCCATRTSGRPAYRAPTARSRSICPRAACAKRRGCSKACARGSRWARSSATASNACCTTRRRQRPQPGSLHRAAAPSRAARRRARARDHRRRWKPSPPTTSSTAWCCIAGGRKSAAPCVAELNKAGMGTERSRRRSPRYSTGSADAIDGLSDALTAESAYQMVRGNTSRTASTLAAIAQGDAPPPELEVARMPRSGTSLTHRVLLLMSGPNVEHTRLGRASTRGRALRGRADAQLLGVQAARRRHARCAARSSGSTRPPGAVAETRTLPLSELEHRAARRRLRRGSRQHHRAARHGARARSNSRSSTTRRHKTGGFDPLATLRLQHARPTDLAAGEVTLFDVLEQARAVRRLLQRRARRGSRGPQPAGAHRTRHDRSRGTRSARRQGRERARTPRTQALSQPDRPDHDHDDGGDAAHGAAEARRFRRRVRRSR